MAKIIFITTDSTGERIEVTMSDSMAAYAYKATATAFVDMITNITVVHKGKAHPLEGKEVQEYINNCIIKKLAALEKMDLELEKIIKDASSR